MCADQKRKCLDDTIKRELNWNKGDDAIKMELNCIRGKRSSMTSLFNTIREQMGMMKRIKLNQTY